MLDLNKGFMFKLQNSNINKMITMRNRNRDMNASVPIETRKDKPRSGTSKEFQAIINEKKQKDILSSYERRKQQELRPMQFNTPTDQMFSMVKKFFVRIDSPVKSNSSSKLRVS